MAETAKATTPAIHVKVFNQTFDLSTDNPSLDPLIDFVANNRDLDYKQLSVTCDSEDFDIDAFQKALIEEISEFLKNIKQNEDDLNTALGQIPA